ncbi:hypothetical protein AWC38_SpisGene9875 [Stylophora pistillata]|uniref:Uncharacterized protein n=1 Tax=Stylophora pistillata TaxID=50429 RepID=A0A2B4SAK1_STYPI|nr:hypothetical protein AWC38_SpisGene9875 [Stylophora pistillata]
MSGKTEVLWDRCSGIWKLLPLERESFHRENKMPEDVPLSKLQFTKQHIFEALHQRQPEELQLAVIGLSDEYQLSNVVAHLAVAPEVWFQWNEEDWKEYITKFNFMSLEDAQAKKTISIKTASGVPATGDFQELSAGVSTVLVEKMRHKEEIARVGENGALMLLNSPAAIQKKPTLQQGIAVKFEVDSNSAKHGRVE